MHRHSNRKGVLGTEGGPKRHLQLSGMISLKLSHLRVSIGLYFIQSDDSLIFFIQTKTKQKETNYKQV